MRVGVPRAPARGDEGGLVNDKVAEEIKMHAETIESDSNTPLHLIREKELEISGRVLAAKREADQIVADARMRAAEIVRAAEAEGGASAADLERSIREQAEKEAAEIKAAAERDAAELQTTIEQRRPRAINVVLDAVSQV